DLHPLRALFKLHRVVIERLLLSVRDLTQFTAEGRDAADDRFAEGDVRDAPGGQKGRTRFVRERLYVRSLREVFRRAFQGRGGQLQGQGLFGRRVGGQPGRGERKQKSCDHRCQVNFQRVFRL